MGRSLPPLPAGEPRSDSKFVLYDVDLSGWVDSSRLICCCSHNSETEVQMLRQLTAAFISERGQP